MYEALAYAAGVALSPVATVSVLKLLTCRRAVANALSFVAGWIAGVAGGILLFVLVVNVAGLTDSDPTWIAIAEVALGAGFILAAVAVWRNRHRRRPDSPPWMDSVDSFTTVRSAGLGVVLSGANPKILALSLGAALPSHRSRQVRR